MLVGGLLGVLTTHFKVSKYYEIDFGLVIFRYIDPRNKVFNDNFQYEGVLLWLLCCNYESNKI